MEILDALVVYRNSGELTKQQKDLFERRKEAENALRQKGDSFRFDEILSKEMKNGTN